MHVSEYLQGQRRSGSRICQLLTGASPTESKFWGLLICQEASRERAMNEQCSRKCLMPAITNKETLGTSPYSLCFRLSLTEQQTVILTNNLVTTKRCCLFAAVIWLFITTHFKICLKRCKIWTIFFWLVNLPLRILYCKRIKENTDNLLLHPDRKHENFSIAKPIQMLCAETRPWTSSKRIEND